MRGVGTLQTSLSAIDRRDWRRGFIFCARAERHDSTSVARSDGAFVPRPAQLARQRSRARERCQLGLDQLHRRPLDCRVAARSAARSRRTRAVDAPALQRMAREPARQCARCLATMRARILVSRAQLGTRLAELRHEQQRVVAKAVLAAGLLGDHAAVRTARLEHKRPCASMRGTCAHEAAAAIDVAELRPRAALRGGPVLVRARALAAGVTRDGRQGHPLERRPSRCPPRGMPWPGRPRSLRRVRACPAKVSAPRGLRTDCATLSRPHTSMPAARACRRTPSTLWLLVVATQLTRLRLVERRSSHCEVVVCHQLRKPG